MIRAIAVAALLATTTVAAQQPDLSGTWVRNDSAAPVPVATTGDAAFRRGEMGVGLGSPLTITQRGVHLVVEYAYFGAYDLQPKVRLSYALDGSRSTNALMVGHAEAIVHSTASWSGGALVIVSEYAGPPGRDQSAFTTEVRQSFRLDSPASLTIETTRPGVAGGTPATSRATYVRR